MWEKDRKKNNVFWSLRLQCGSNNILYTQGMWMHSYWFEWQVLFSFCFLNNLVTVFVKGKMVPPTRLFSEMRLWNWIFSHASLRGRATKSLFQEAECRGIMKRTTWQPGKYDHPLSVRADALYQCTSKPKRPGLIGTGECWGVLQVWKKECFAAATWFVCHTTWHLSSLESYMLVSFFTFHSIGWHSFSVQAVHTSI